ncbi:pyridoxal-dependent decarboxylase, partial [Cetobacterium sp.]
MLHRRKSGEEKEKEYMFTPDSSTTPLFGSSESNHILPRETINDNAINPNIAYQLISDEMMHDGNPRYNLCTFVQTYMEPEAKQVMVDAIATNAIDKAEYPQTTEVEKRCVSIISDLWNAPKDEEYMGTSTVGSSEACMLGGMAMK